ncbi:solute carrier family 22 member 6-like protein [Columba livia]|nr:solute carrier family 22 member 6-like protein [Columba livia]
MGTQASGGGWGPRDPGGRGPRRPGVTRLFPGSGTWCARPRRCGTWPSPSTWRGSCWGPSSSGSCPTGTAGTGGTGGNWDELGGTRRNWEGVGMGMEVLGGTGRRRGGETSCVPIPVLSVPHVTHPSAPSAPCPHPSAPCHPSQCSQCSVSPSQCSQCPVSPIPVLPVLRVTHTSALSAPCHPSQCLPVPHVTHPSAPSAPSAVSHRWGRRLVLSCCYLQLGASGTVTSVAPTFVTYCLCRCLGGMAMAGVSINSASLCMEWIPTGARAVVGTINGYSYTLGQFVLAGMAFAFPHWRRLQLAVSLPFFLFFLYSCFAYYGLAMDLQGFGVDVYVSQLLFAAVDVPAKLASAVAVMRGGRRVAQAGSLALAGGCILATMLVPNELQALRLTLAVIGKGALAASFNCAYIFTGELFPTAIRQTGLGLGSTMARVGGMMAPLVRVAGDVAPVLPPIIYGVTPVLSALLTLLLPETRNVPLPETLRDLEMR